MPPDTVPLYLDGRRIGTCHAEIGTDGAVRMVATLDGTGGAMQETPTLSGEDAKAVWEELQRPIDPAKVETLRQQLRDRTRGVEKGRRR